MGAFTKLFGKGKAAKQLGGYFEMLDGYTPVFSHAPVFIPLPITAAS